MKKTIIITIIVCSVLLYFMFGTPTPHEVGIEQGIGNAQSLDNIETDTPMAEIQSNGLAKAETETDNKNITDYPIVVFIVSTEETSELNGLNSTAIICYTTPVKDGYVWRGGNGSWASFTDLYYSVRAFGDENGITSVKATEYVFGERTDRPVYIRQVIGIATKIIREVCI